MGEGNNSTFLIKSSADRNQSFGTGFCVHKDEKGSFLLTAGHVVDSCGRNHLLVASYSATLLHISQDDDTLDLALIYVEGLTDTSPLNLSDEKAKENDKFTIVGYRPHKNYHAKEPLKGYIKKAYSLESKEHTRDIYELTINDGDSIEQGYSGSAVLSAVTGLVVAIATDRKTNGKQAFATPVYYLGEIWEDMPDDTFVKILEKNGLKDLKNKLIEENSPLKEITKKVLWFITFFKEYPFFSIILSLCIILYFGYENKSFISSSLKSLKIQEENQTIIIKQILKGNVTDIEGGIALGNVTIRILEKNVKFTTRKDGKYQFDIDGNKGDIVKLDFEKDDYKLCDKNDRKQRLGEERNVLLCKDFY